MFECRSADLKGKVVRSFIQELGIEVPSDIDNITLGSLYKITNRDSEMIIEPVGNLED